MAQLVKCLWHKQEDLRLEPQHQCTKLGKVAHTCRPRAGEAKAENCRPLVSLAESVNSRFGKRWFQKIRWRPGRVTQ